MRAVLQRVSSAAVRVEGAVVGSIQQGILAYIGIAQDDTEADVARIVDKIIHVRIFSDEDGRMNRSLCDVQGSVLAVSQFTLYGDARKGRRPSYHQAADEQHARQLFDDLCRELRERGIHTETGIFQAYMQVQSGNDGPVTILLDSSRAF
ncbi:D-aminoacyl-tRNA deacylase [Spirochaeta africana]|uniref:D-aminoacyl-tRNA deacylase n=1 Tax=Spirochaeta africana (strain ATCC 700263 / DSM 8902 / Z-7692) TaxID=889378 RepID=H9UJ89_SPIAZ|nr:D-aminoacyl-tRNA deacylase [Spirochaeta africana]AFG37582.1 D-tyrosyl-tRNA(Tyr) deacylase [Spirochaeta africana DSM 8902]